MSDKPTNKNGSVQRRSLNEEVERLHDVLDGLSENLEGAVVAAVTGSARRRARPS